MRQAGLRLRRLLLRVSLIGTLSRNPIKCNLKHFPVQHCEQKTFNFCSSGTQRPPTASRSIETSGPTTGSAVGTRRS